MHSPLILIAVAVVAYMCRASGFALPLRETSPQWERFLRLVPTAVFAALTVVSLSTNGDTLPSELIALFLAGAVIWRWRGFALAVMVGLMAFWFLVEIGFG